MLQKQYTVYKHLKLTKDGPSYRWYYYYYDSTGKKIQRACKKCTTKEEAEAYVQNLPQVSDILKRSNFIKDIAENMFTIDSDHMIRRDQLGKSTYTSTIKESRRFVELIISMWGHLELQQLHSEIVMKFLFSMKRSGKWKNKFIEVLNEIYSEAKWFRCRAKKLDLSRFGCRTKKADAFSEVEINKWMKPENFPEYQFYLMFLLTLSAGLRLGEARAVKPRQIQFEPERELIIVDGFIRQDGTRTNFNKKGNEESPRFRIVYLNRIILNQLQDWIIKNDLMPDDYMFTYNGKIIRAELAENVFYKSLQKCGIIPTPEPKPHNKRGEGRKKQDKKKIKPKCGRKLVPHSLRYTYITMMLNHVTDRQLLPMTGHTCETNVNYYHKKVLDMTVASLPLSLREATDNMFHWEKLTEPLHPEIQQPELFDSVFCPPF